MQGLVAVLGRVEVVGAGGVAGEGHVRQTGVWIFLEKLQKRIRSQDLVLRNYQTSSMP